MEVSAFRQEHRDHKVRIMMRRKMDGESRFKVKFRIENLDGGHFTGSLMYRKKPRLSRVMRFLFSELDLPQAMVHADGGKNLVHQGI